MIIHGKSAGRPDLRTAVENLRSDIAGFGISGSSDLTWNVLLMGQVKVAKRIGLLLGYRWLDIDYENKDDLFALDARMAGPMLAISYSFY